MYGKALKITFPWPIAPLALLGWLVPAAVLAQSPIPDREDADPATTVHFAFGRSEIRSVDGPALDSLAALLWADTSAKLYLDTHTDAEGSEAYNDLLSQQRANSVLLFFEKKGIPRSRAVWTAHGEQRPLDDNRTAVGRQNNRRATLVVRTGNPPARPVGTRPVAPEPAPPPAPTTKLPCHGALLTVLDEKTLLPLKSRAIVRQGGFADTLFSDEKGTFELLFVRQAPIDLEVTAQGHIFRKTTIEYSCHPSPITLQLQPLAVGTLAKLENIFFVSDQATMLESSKPTLQALLAFLKENPKVHIQINGHVNYPFLPPLKQQSGEFRLSERRAEAVRQYLTQNGISGDRLTCKGFGNHRMIYPEARTPEHEQANRRVEIVILRNDD
jgi:outer membrane protein OmpA-like peptidoglycan-associated protein